MLQLLGIQGSRQRDGLELALEAQDDSQVELDRVVALYKLPSDERRQALIDAGVPKFQIENAKKIFPALAKSAGLVIEDLSHVFQLTDIGRALIDADEPEDALPTGQGTFRRALRSVNAETIASMLGGASSKPLTPAQQAAARQALSKRHKRHNETVQALASLFIEGDLQEGSVDLLWISKQADGPVILVEVKTINADADIQIRHAYGQVGFYEYFDVRALADGREILQVVATDNDVQESLGLFLEDRGIALITVTDGGWKMHNELAKGLKPYLKVPPTD